MIRVILTNFRVYWRFWEQNHFPGVITISFWYIRCDSVEYVDQYQKYCNEKSHSTGNDIWWNEKTNPWTNNKHPRWKVACDDIMHCFPFQSQLKTSNRKISYVKRYSGKISFNVLRYLFFCKYVYNYLRNNLPGMATKYFSSFGSSLIVIS